MIVTVINTTIVITTIYSLVHMDIIIGVPTAIITVLILHSRIGTTAFQFVNAYSY